jgi:23S rRNA (adenine2030-N6)-methyltransferase
MNYRHGYHAGNFADVVKHIALIAILAHLKKKATPFAVIDTHAGRGLYDLGGEEARRTGEAAGGVEKLRRLDGALPPSLAAYIECVGQGASYPGSPLIAARLLRPQDRLVAIEKHPEEAAALRLALAPGRRTSVEIADGYARLPKLLPPPERRGLILIDPPFEDPREFAGLAVGLAKGHARFRTGVYAAWYPIKHRAPVRQFFAHLCDIGIRDIVSAELCLREPIDPTRLNGCGMLVINPPYRFEQDIPPILTALLDRLGNREPGEGAAITRLVDE